MRISERISHGTGSAPCCRALRDRWEEGTRREWRCPRAGRAGSGTSSSQHNWRALGAATTRARAARPSDSHLQKYSDTSRTGKREKFPPCRASRSWDLPLGRVGPEEEKKAFEFSCLTHCWRGPSLKVRLFPSGLHSCKVSHYFMLLTCKPGAVMVPWLILPVCACCEPCILFQSCSHCTETTLRSM